MAGKKKSMIDTAREMALGAAKDPVGAAKFARDVAVVTAKDAAGKGKKAADEVIKKVTGS